MYEPMLQMLQSMTEWETRTQERANAIIAIRTIQSGLPENPALDAACHVLALTAITSASFANCDSKFIANNKPELFGADHAHLIGEDHE